MGATQGTFLHGLQTIEEVVHNNAVLQGKIEVCQNRFKRREKLDQVSKDLFLLYRAQAKGVVVFVVLLISITEDVWAGGDKVQTLQSTNVIPLQILALYLFETAIVEEIRVCKQQVIHYPIVAVIKDKHDYFYAVFCATPYVLRDVTLKESLVLANKVPNSKINSKNKTLIRRLPRRKVSLSFSITTARSSHLYTCYCRGFRYS